MLRLSHEARRKPDPGSSHLEVLLGHSALRTAWWYRQQHQQLAAKIVSGVSYSLGCFLLLPESLHVSLS